MSEILDEENLKSDEKILLSWANVAKNSLQMWNGFSSYHLVLGKNSNLPNIMTEKLPALQGVTTSEILKHYLDAMHSARKAFVKCEADEKITELCIFQIEQQKKHLTQETVYSTRKKERTDGLDLAKLFFKMAGLFL